MTIEEMNNVIQDHCHRQNDRCEECPIEDICNPIMGDFKDHPKFLEMAYDIVKPNGDNVNHPSHYNQGGIECIDAMVSAFGKQAVSSFCLCNAFKYIWRADHKNGLEDIEKANWYINKYKELTADEAV